MMGLFKKSKPLALPKPAFKHAANGDHRAAFARARFGNSFRTLSISSPLFEISLPVYRTAAWLGDGYRVFEVSGQLPESGMPPLSKIKADKLDFISAMEHLAEWQAAQIKEGGVIDAADAGKLGDSYFIPFGERENLAFDAFNQPHITFMGEVVGEGYFTEEARARAKVTLNQLPVAAEGALIKINMFGDFFESVSAVPGNPDLNHIYDALHHHAQCGDLLDKYKTATDVLTRKNFHNDGTMEYYIQHCEKTLENINLNPEEKNFFAFVNDLYRIAYFSMAAKSRLQYAAKNGGARFVEDADSFTRKAESIYKNLRAPANAMWKIRAYTLEDSGLETPASITDFMESFERSIKERGEAVHARKNAAISVQPVARISGPQ